MTDPTGDPERQRIFVALDLPLSIQQGIAAWVSAALAHPELRVVRPEALHVTLSFLGTCDRLRVGGAIAAVDALVVEPVSLRLQPRPVRRPERRPRLLALEVESDGLHALQRRLVADLTATGLAEPESRPFWPHVTVARSRAEPWPPGLGDQPQALPAVLTDPFDGVRVSVYRSVSRFGGSEYVPLAGKDLPPTA